MKIFPKFDPKYTIPKNEAYLQAELYHQCKLHEIECHLEVVYPNCGRMDAILEFIGKFYIIEVKKNKCALDINDKAQFRKYLKMGIPLIVIYDIAQIGILLNLIKTDTKFDDDLYIFDENLKQFRRQPHTYLIYTY